MVATLRLAGALGEELQALVLDVRRLFLLPDAPPEATTGSPSTVPQQVSQVARLREELTGIIETSERSQLEAARQQLESIFDTFARGFAPQSSLGLRRGLDPDRPGDGG